MLRISRPVALAAALSTAYCALLAQTSLPVTLRINSDQTAAHVSPWLYGLMTEEINYSYDGGLYAELVRNRNFKEDAAQPAHWQLVERGGGTGKMELDPTTPFNDAVPVSLKLTAATPRAVSQVGIANDGFWGIPVHPNTKYHATVYAKAGKGFTGSLAIALMSEGNTPLASAQIPRLTTEWRKYEADLTVGNVAASSNNRLALTTGKPGTVWFGMVSLFPPAYNNRPNGRRADIMRLLADMHPAFLRFPGGNYLEGNTVATRFDWKKTIGDISQRPGHMNDAWKYWSSDGMGLLEFLEWCEDLQMQPLLAVYAGFSLKGERIAPGPALEPFVKDALDEIEYVTGGAGTVWGARRAKDGHAAPFPLEYVEIGNEDQFDRVGGGIYDGRFTQFYDAIKQKYPNLKLIATAKVTTRTPDVIDEHYYRRSEDEMASHAHDYDTRPRTGPKVFVGEWATRVGEPTPNMSSALGDAAWMTGMERNSDLVLASSYAPLFVNVNPGGMQWKTDLIGYDAMSSYGSPAYYAQQMFSSHHGDIVLPVTAKDVPARDWQPPTPAPQKTGSTPPTIPPLPPDPKHVPLIFYSATRDSKTGAIYLKIVNRSGAAQPVRVEFTGLGSVEAKGKAITLAAGSPNDTNTITEPNKIAPVTSDIDGLGFTFTRSFAPYSITILQMKSK